MTSIFNRRQALALGAGAIGVAMLGASTPALAKNDADELIKKFTGGKTPVQGKVKLDLPEIAENGNTVPMTVTVESPMTEQSHVTEVLIVADGNPRAGIATFHFSPRERRRRSQHPHPPRRDAERHRGRQDERRLVLHGEQAGQGHDRRLRRLTTPTHGNDFRRQPWPSSRASSSTRRKPRRATSSR